MIQAVARRAFTPTAFRTPPTKYLSSAPHIVCELSYAITCPPNLNSSGRYFYSKKFVVLPTVRIRSGSLASGPVRLGIRTEAGQSRRIGYRFPGNGRNLQGERLGSTRCPALLRS